MSDLEKLSGSRVRRHQCVLLHKPKKSGSRDNYSPQNHPNRTFTGNTWLNVRLGFSVLVGMFTLAVNTGQAEPTTNQRLSVFQGLNNNGEPSMAVQLTHIGSLPVDAKMEIGTGHNVLAVPVSLVLGASAYSSNGIHPQYRLSQLHGIKITGKRIIRRCGNGSSVQTCYGVYAQAPFTFATEQGALTTTEEPFFLYYRIETHGRSLPLAQQHILWGITPDPQSDQKLLTAFPFQNQLREAAKSFQPKAAKAIEGKACKLFSQKCEQPQLWLNFQSLDLNNTELLLSKTNS